jgi:hypothetical protein
MSNILHDRMSWLRQNFGQFQRPAWPAGSWPNCRTDRGEVTGQVKINAATAEE